MRKIAKIITYILHSYLVMLLTLFINPSTPQFERDNISNTAIYYALFVFLPMIFHLFCCNVIFDDKEEWVDRLKLTVPFSATYFGLIFVILQEDLNIVVYISASTFSTMLALTYRFFEEMYFTNN
jgi:ABC-type Na+ efflux pump permease subunit